MVNTRTNEPRVLDEMLRLAALQTFAVGEFIRINGGEGTSNKGGGYERLTRLDFPKFSGDDVNGWLFRVQQFFLIDNVQEDQKIGLVSMHLYDKNLKQDGEVKVYQEQSESLLNRLDLTESYAVCFFIGGLKSEIGMPVKMFKPTTLKDASCLARMQEATLALPKAKLASQYGGYRSNSGTYSNRYVSSSTPVTKPVLVLPSFTTENAGKVVKIRFRKQLTQKEFEEKRAKGIWFYCDQKYAPGNKCTGHLYSLEVSVDEEDQEEEVCIDIEVRDDTHVATYTKSFPHISLHALSGVNTSAAKRLPCQLSATTPLRVDVDCMLLPLGGCNMVLGIQWLSTLGDINCKFKNLTMKSNYRGKKIVLRGSQLGSLQWIQGKQVITEGQWKQAQLASMIVYVYPAQLMKIQGEAVRIFDDKLTLKQLLSTYEDVFAMPTEFPPPRSHDHTITLLPNTPPVTVTPYRLPPNQKRCCETNGEGIVRCLSNQRKSKPLFFTYCDGVATNPLKIQAMASWPIPKTLKQLKEAEVAFNKLKQGMMSSPLLALPNFEKEFIMETDASGSGIGVVLHQEGHHIAYLSKALSPRHQALSTYEKEFLAVMMALDKWRGYMLDRHFKIKTNHFSLKYLLDQRLTTPFQTKWLPKLLGFDYEISYKKGAENEAADALLSHFAEFKGCGLLEGYEEMGQNKVKDCDVCQRNKPDLSAYPVYGQPPPTYVPYESGDSPVESVDRSLQAREQTIQQLKFHLQRSQDRMRNLANKHRTDRQFKVGIQIHNVFHVSQLKKCTHPVEASGVLPAVDSEGLLLKTPAAILDRRLGKVRNSPVMYVLVQWTDESVEDVT
uniref:Gypsy/Ty3 retroelement polyprotein n=1 Tax=Tanacetum cinerariifolium TaxID=118510 RepID=A0A699HZL6_TANCI|nr:gypsy/Ty3 retroelement polyprotein [Tanacetum cinerariifolium]